MADWTAEDVATLRAAVATGILSVRYSGPPEREVRYQTLSEMRSLLAEMVAAVATAAGTRQPFRFATHNKGFTSDDE